MSERRLLMSHRSPFARKVRVALLEKGLDFEEVVVDLEHKPSELVNCGPIQKIPVLIDNGLAIADSSVILEYLEERYPAISLMPHGYLPRADARMWSQTCNEACEAAIKIVMERKKPGGLQDYAAIAKAEGMIKRVLDYAERVLGNRVFLVSNAFTVADISLVSALGYVEFRLGPDWRKGRPVISHYLDSMSKMECFVKTVPKA